MLYFVFLGSHFFLLCSAIELVCPVSFQWNFSYFDVQFSWLPCSQMSSWLQDECFFFLKIICIFLIVRVGMIFSCRFLHSKNILFYQHIVFYRKFLKRNICFFVFTCIFTIFSSCPFFLFEFLPIIISVQPEEF